MSLHHHVSSLHSKKPFCVLENPFQVQKSIYDRYYANGDRWYSSYSSWVRLDGPWNEFCFVNPTECQEGVSIEFWLKPFDDGDYFTTRKDSYSQGIVIYKDNLKLHVDIYTERKMIKTSANMFEGKWSHIVFIYNNLDETTDIYINGTKSSSASETDSMFFSLKPPVFLMGKLRGTDNYGDLDSFIDELAIWEQVLSAEEVLKLFQGCDCSLLSCMLPATVQNATIQYNTRRDPGGDSSMCPGDALTYTCDDSYQLKSGDLSRMCQENSLLSGKAPVCGKEYYVSTLLLATATCYGTSLISCCGGRLLM